MSRTLVLADVHANAAALEAVLAAEPDHDSVVFLGDAVDNGPHPDAVCERLRGLDLVGAVEGNHDRDVLAVGEDDGPDEGPFAGWKEWTYERLSAANRAFLDSLVVTTAVTLGDRAVRLHHGDFQPPEDHDGQWVTRTTPEESPSLFEQVAEGYDEDVVFHGHSHYPFEATVAGTTFVNPGSVGLQREGWPEDCARYATVEDGTVELRSVEYDTEPLTADLQAFDSPFRTIWEGSDAAATSD